MWLIIPVAIIAAWIGRRSATHQWQTPPLLKSNTQVDAGKLLDIARAGAGEGRTYAILTRDGKFITAFPTIANVAVWTSRNPGRWYIADLDKEVVTEAQS